MRGILRKPSFSFQRFQPSSVNQFQALQIRIVREHPQPEAYGVRSRAGVTERIIDFEK